jgi:hypothetical protein
MKRQRNMGRGAMLYKDNLFIILLFSIAQMFIKKEEKKLERQRFIEGRKEALKVLLRIIMSFIGMKKRRIR